MWVPLESLEEDQSGSFSRTCTAKCEIEMHVGVLYVSMSESSLSIDGDAMSLLAFRRGLVLKRGTDEPVVMDKRRSHVLPDLGSEADDASLSASDMLLAIFVGCFVFSSHKISVCRMTSTT